MRISRQKAVRLQEVADQFGIVLVLAFGSRVSQQTHSGSDLDLAVQFEDADLDYRKLAKLQHRLQLIFVGEQLDITVVNHADPLLLKRITETNQLLCGEERALQKLRLYAFRRYQDHRRYFELERRFARRFIREINTVS